VGREEEVKRARETYERLRGSKESQQRRLEEEAEEDERTGALGLFNFAETYWSAARALSRAKYKGTHREAPIRYLYYHALELYLKSFARMVGVTVKDLAGRKYGHRYCCLLEVATENGVPMMDEDVAVFAMLINSDAVIRSRYLQTGYFSWPAVEALDRTVMSLREPIGKALQNAGYVVRI
jgi:hypothetical protein